MLIFFLFFVLFCFGLLFAVCISHSHLIPDDLEREKRALLDSLEERRRIDAALMEKLKQARLQFGTVAPSNEVESLKVQLDRSETARAELADVLLKILQGP